VEEREKILKDLLLKKGSIDNLLNLIKKGGLWKMQD